MRTYKISLLALLIICSCEVTVLAGEVDLSNLSKPDVSSHACILEQKHDELSHWNECSICKEKTELGNHTLSTEYTLGNG